jgi:hypothetical protein
MPKPRFYQCDICGYYHPWGFDGDCRAGAPSRLNYDQLPEDAEVFLTEERLEMEE